VGKVTLKERLRQGVFVLDGAMGTQLITHGIQPGTCNEMLNLDSADVILRIHKSYLEAGSDVVLTNTFGGNRFSLARHGLAGRVGEINTAAAKLAREAAGQDKYVLGDIGPTGDFLEPLGSLKSDELKAAFAEQAKALLDGGVDGFIIETMAAVDEATIAIEAARSVSDSLPVFASMSFDKRGPDFRTMMGVDVKTAVSVLVSADVVGFNCGTETLDEYAELAKRYMAAVQESGEGALVFAEPNAGKPELVDGKAVYKVTPEEFGEAAVKIRAAGISIIGGCCGTSPEHIKALANKLRG